MKLCVVLLLLLLATCSVSTLSVSSENVALRGKATQSTNHHGFPTELISASNAIDGKRDNKLHSGSCTHTEGESNPWWKVDLLEHFIITSVIISNRGDCCSGRLVGAQVHIGNSVVDNGAINPVVHTITTVEELYTLTFTDLVEGRYVTVRIPGEVNILTLCEVEVYGHHDPAVNLAIQGQATQSSLYQYDTNADATKAIDGIRTSRFEDGSCTHTNHDLNPWWRLALSKTHKVFSVKITNRDEVPERLNGAEIRIGDSLVNNGADNPRFALITCLPAGQTVVFKDSNGMDGRYVYIGIPGRKEHLALCEVEVYGSAPDFEPM